MRHATILVAILAFVPLASATAQVRQPPIERGARVRVTRRTCPPNVTCVGGSPQQYVGTFVTWEADTLVMESKGNALALALDPVTKLEVSRGRNNGAVAPAAVGDVQPDRTALRRANS